jgi:Fe-S cluster biogenesis protein NfuA
LSGLAHLEVQLKADALVERATISERRPHPLPSTPLVCIGPDKKGLNEQAARLQSLMEKVEQLPDPAARALTRQCLESILSLYGEGLARVLAIVQQNEKINTSIMDGLASDSTIAGLLLIHGLHPVDLPTRLQQALDRIRPYMESHGGNVELLGLDQGVARLRLKGTCKSCPSSSVTLELAVRSALEEACPDLAGFEVE